MNLIHKFIEKNQLKIYTVYIIEEMNFHFWVNCTFNKWKLKTFKDKYYTVWLSGFAAF